MSSRRRKFIFGLAAPSFVPHLPSKWSAPAINSVVTLAHAQTSCVNSLCADGVSTWLMSDYVENGVAFAQGEPQSQLETIVSGMSISVVTDHGSIDLSTGAVGTNPFSHLSR